MNGTVTERPKEPTVLSGDAPGPFSKMLPSPSVEIPTLASPNLCSELRSREHRLYRHRCLTEVGDNILPVHNGAPGAARRSAIADTVSPGSGAESLPVLPR